MILRLIFCFCLLALMGSDTYGQRSKIKFRNRLGDTLVLKDVSEKAIKKKPLPVYSSQIAIGPYLSTDAYGISIQYGKAFGEDEFGTENFNKNYHTHIITLDLLERLHPKEYIAILDNNILGMIFLRGINQPAIYGKTINFYNARLTYGQRRLFGGRGEEQSPLVQYYYQGGLTLGLLKPYYIMHEELNMIKYSDSIKRQFIETGKIKGKGGISYGWDELSINAGLIVKGGFHIDFAKKIKNISAFDIGISAEYFFTPILQMAYNDKRSFYASIYLNYFIGKRFKGSSK